jgi:hypothetical protein
MITYIVELDTADGPAVLEVPTTQGPEAAGRKARLAAVRKGWGDLPLVHVRRVYLDDPDPEGCGGCENGECCGEGINPCCGLGEYGICE